MPAPTPFAGAVATAGQDVRVDAGGYAALFDASRRVLRERGFVLERVDATQGVITTRPRDARPWPGVSELRVTSAGDATEDLLNNQARRVRIVFVRADDTDATEPRPPTPTDAAIARVSVAIERAWTPTRRPEARVPTMTRNSEDPALSRRGMGGQWSGVVRQDEALAQLLAEQIAQAIQP